MYDIENYCTNTVLQPYTMRNGTCMMSVRGSRIQRYVRAYLRRRRGAQAPGGITGINRVADVAVVVVVVVAATTAGIYAAERANRVRVLTAIFGGFRWRAT